MGGVMWRGQLRPTAEFNWVVQTYMIGRVLM